MSGRKLSVEAAAAVDEFMNRHMAAIKTFMASDEPLWRRTWDGMKCFAKMPLTHVPKKLQDEIHGRFLAINKITGKYPIKTEEDLALVSDEDLLAIQGIITDFMTGNDY